MDMERDIDARFIPRASLGPGAKTLKQRRDTVCMPQRLLEGPGIMLAGQLGDGIGRYRLGHMDSGLGKLL